MSLGKSFAAFIKPISGKDATAHHSPWRYTTSQPIEAQAAPICPADKVTWRASSGMAKNAMTEGTSPSMKPREILDAKPEILTRQNPAQRNHPVGSAWRDQDLRVGLVKAAEHFVE